MLGVGLHFLPRLRGAPLAGARLAPLALGALVLGLALRALAQPAAAAGAATAIARPALLLSGVLELAGAVLAVGMLTATLRSGPPLAARAGLRPVLPFLAVAFASLVLALSANLWGLLAGTAPVPGWSGRAAVLLGLEGFLVPVAIGMSARVLPLYARTRSPAPAVLQVGLIAWVAGLSLRLADVAVGAIAQAAGLGLFLVGLAVFAPRVARPRDPGPTWADPTQWYILTAYGWLAVAGLVLAGGAGADAERHAIGAGFLTLLIFGVGARMLPGFARRSTGSQTLVWATLLLGNGAAALRALPPLWPTPLPTAVVAGAFVAAGVLGTVAVATFAANAVGPANGERASASPAVPGGSTPRG